MTAIESSRIGEILAPRRTASGWSSPHGIDATLLPWRMWEKAKKLFWDPAAIDYSQDAEQWKLLDVEQQDAVVGVALGFMVGEEAVTLDILPLTLAIADEGRLEEVIFLSSFALEEAKHVDFFRRWLSAVDADIEGYTTRAEARAVEAGLTFDMESTTGMWESELPRVMRRVLVDRSPEAMLDASVTYNQFVEGCLAISGYEVWSNLFEMLGAMPGMQEGLRHVRADEARHITYGTYLCNRVLAANPELIDFAKARMFELRDIWFAANPSIDGPDDDIQAQISKDFERRVDTQIARRIAVMERAAQMDEVEMIRSSVAEEAEADLLSIT